MLKKKVNFVAYYLTNFEILYLKKDLQKDLQKVLKETFGYSAFRLGQEEIITSILEGNDTNVIMPTGGGKSLCYQVPAILSEGCAIVVSPLISLMQDQVNALVQKGIGAAIINSTIEFSQINYILDNLSVNRIKLLYIAPERLKSHSFLKRLKEIDISFIAVDEAHCVSEWGHDFRPSYRKIADIFNIIGEKAVIALTATATKEVADDIEKSLYMDNPVRFVRGFDRKNLNLSVIKCEDGRKEKDQNLLNIVNSTKDGSIIIYCGSRKRVEECRQFLNENNIDSEHYHAGLTAIIRKNVQDRFINGKTNIIIATNAFGMGIDKSDVRKVIHYDMPITMEAYYQEAGRAGRDGKQSDCILLYSNKDLQLQHFFCKVKHPSYGDLKMVFQTIEEFAGNKNEYITENIVFDIVNSNNIKHYSIDKIISLLDQEGLIQRRSLSSGIFISLLEEKPRIREYYNNLDADRQEALRAIMQSLPSNAFYEKTKLDLNKIRIDYGISEKKLKVYLRDFALSGIIEYKQNELDNVLYSIKNSEMALIRDIAKEQDARRENSYIKLYSMIQYCETIECKRNYILDYFGDKEYSDRCDRCSSCKSNLHEQKDAEKVLVLELLILNYISLNKQLLIWNNVVSNFSKSSKINSMISNKDAIYSKKMVNMAITNLFRKMIVDSEERFETPLKLTEFGKIILKII